MHGTVENNLNLFGGLTFGRPKNEEILLTFLKLFHFGVSMHFRLVFLAFKKHGPCWRGFF